MGDQGQQLHCGLETADEYRIGGSDAYEASHKEGGEEDGKAGCEEDCQEGEESILSKDQDYRP